MLWRSRHQYRVKNGGQQLKLKCPEWWSYMYVNFKYLCDHFDEYGISPKKSNPFDSEERLIALKIKSCWKGSWAIWNGSTHSISPIIIDGVIAILSCLQIMILYSEWQSVIWKVTMSWWDQCLCDWDALLGGTFCLACSSWQRPNLMGTEIEKNTPFFIHSKGFNLWQFKKENCRSKCICPAKK